MTLLRLRVTVGVTLCRYAELRMKAGGRRRQWRYRNNGLAVGCQASCVAVGHERDQGHIITLDDAGCLEFIADGLGWRDITCGNTFDTLCERE